MRWQHTRLFLHPPGATDRSATISRPLVVGLPQSCELGPPVGAVLSVEGLKVTPSQWTCLAAVPPAGTE